MPDFKIADNMQLIVVGKDYYLVVSNQNGEVSILISYDIYLLLRNVKNNNPVSTKEIERKFLVEAVPNLDNCISYDIEQFYVLRDEENKSSVRIRRTVNKISNCYFLTLKSGKGIDRVEIEFEISHIDFIGSKKIKISNSICKTRYELPIGDNLVAEIDFFHGKYGGRVVVEVEFSSIEEANSFNPPDWFGDDVTNNDLYLNMNMAFL